MKPKILFISFIAAGVALAEPSKPDSTAIISHIPRERVESTGLATVGYSKRRHILEIEFANGAIYRYVDVPPLVHRELMGAESKARYYVLNIRRKYRSYRVRPRIDDRSAN
jgi:KTSC domain-containing protein